LDRGWRRRRLALPCYCVLIAALNAFLFVLLKYKSPPEDKAACATSGAGIFVHLQQEAWPVRPPGRKINSRLFQAASIGVQRREKSAVE
jgi:hypothetical protein